MDSCNQIRTDPHAHTKLLPSLHSLTLWDVTADAGWRQLVDYLVHQKPVCQVISIRLELKGGCSSVPPEVAKEIEGLVKVLNFSEISEDDG